MFIEITGGSGSGKSAFAEQQVVSFGQKVRYYIATMECYDDESKKRVARHRAMRAGKGFDTIECPRDLEKVCLDERGTVLLECMSNLAANEMFAGGILHDPDEIASHILCGVKKLYEQCDHLVIVTNEVFSDGILYDPWTQAYNACLGKINSEIAGYADEVVEVVYSLPVYHKREVSEIEYHL